MSVTRPNGVFEGGVFRFPLKVYYEDTDFSGFVYHANYLKFFERGRSEALHHAGVSHRDLLSWDPPAALVVRRLEIDFLRPAIVEDELLVHSRFSSARGARLLISQWLERGGEQLASAELEVALIGLDGRPRKIPTVLLAQLSPFIAVSRP
jgi:acyl-CoA thioester hydrolase